MFRLRVPALSDGQAMIRAGDGKRDPVGPTVQQDPVAIDPATLDVLNVVMSDEDIAARHQLKISDIRKKIRLQYRRNHGRGLLQV